MEPLVICGIDTDVGKTIATGLLARFLLEHGHSVITMKPVQTGSLQPDDLHCHRQIMQIDFLPEDEEGRTCPYCFPFPASPQLAARLAEQRIDRDLILANMEFLQQRYDWLLVEGAGGLLVPLDDDLLFVDMLPKQVGMILVTSPRLGSINHTLLSIEAMASRKRILKGIVYNLYGQHPPEIVSDSLRCFRRTLDLHFPEAQLVIMPDMHESKNSNWAALAGLDQA